MEKSERKNQSIAEENFKKLAALFPDAITEIKNENGDLIQAIDFDILKMVQHKHKSVSIRL